MARAPRTIIAALCIAAVVSAQDTYSWLESLAQKQLAKRREDIAQLRTPEEIRKRGAATRAKLLRWIGGLPEQRTPLNLRRTGTIDRDGYRVEKIIFESQPHFYVTATLHVPTTGKPPYPAVLQPTGHSLTAKARGLYQSLAIGLAKSGFVALTYDPLGQGERRIFFDKDLRDSKVGGTTVEHQMVGVQSLLAGESIARYMIWDAVRGIDVLQSLSYVDADQVGVSGCSGGGTLTAFVAAVDDRIKAAAPSCYITSWQDQLKGTGPQDAEQQFPDQFLESFDHGDLIIAAAPKPYLILATTEDYFPIAGARRTFEDMKRLYDRFGAEDKIALFVAPGGHGMRADTRASVYAWMRKWLRKESGEILPEPSFQVEFEEDLNATETGQVSTSLGGETASTLNIRRFAALRPTSGDVPEAVRRLTRIVYSSGVPATEVISSSERDEVRVETIRYKAGEGRYVPANLYRPNSAARGTVLIVDAAGKASAAAAELAAGGYNVLAIDSALTGETAGKISGYAAEWFPQDKPVWLALMTGRTVTGLRMTDILRGLDLLESRNLTGQGVTGLGIGNPGVALLHAAVLDKRLSRVVLDGMPASYRSMATTPVQKRIFDVVIPGVLRHYDLAQLTESVAPREVMIGNAISPQGQVLGVPEMRTVFPAQNVRILRRREAETVSEIYFPKH